MRKIFGFEITTAIQDRPRSFQLVTLVLLSFSLTIIFLHFFTRVSVPEKNNQAFKQSPPPTEASFVSSPAVQLLNARQK